MEQPVLRKPRNCFDTTPRPSHVTFDDGKHERRNFPWGHYVVARWSSRLVNVHIEDMRAGVHEHLMFGEGEMEFPPIIAALTQNEYTGGVHVELSRHSHEAPAAAARAFRFLSPLVNNS